MSELLCCQCKRPVNSPKDLLCTDCYGNTTDGKLEAAEARITALSQLLEEALPAVEFCAMYKTKSATGAEAAGIAKRIRTALGAAAPVDETKGEG
jgi:hypothetical protein